MDFSMEAQPPNPVRSASATSAGGKIRIFMAYELLESLSVADAAASLVFSQALAAESLVFSATSPAVAAVADATSFVLSQAVVAASPVFSAASLAMLAASAARSFALSHRLFSLIPHPPVSRALRGAVN